MATEVTIVVQPIGQVTISAGDGLASATADQIIYDPTGTDLVATSVGDAIDALANERFAQSADPGATAAEGDVWYDTDDDKLYVRKDSAWVEILVDSITTLDGGTY
tara:strand:+ start:1385 stop:1702 length:318 start_codon:yes stop_codon:yes gene_type:complete